MKSPTKKSTLVLHLCDTWFGGIHTLMPDILIKLNKKITRLTTDTNRSENLCEKAAIYD
jgi:hypothetical protein